MDRHSLLAFRLGEQWYSLPCDLVMQVVSLQTLTPLPFVDEALDGLIGINKCPLLQIDLALALGLEPTPPRTGKCLIVRLKSDRPLALRVAEVGRWIPSNHATRPSILPLPLETLSPYAAAGNAPVAAIQPETASAPLVATPKVPVLRVASAGKTIALLACDIERIQHAPSPIPASLEDAAASLLPTHSLANILHDEPTAPEDFSLIIRHGEMAWRLTVEAVKGLSWEGPVYASAIAEQALWYFSPEGQLQALIDINQQAALEAQPKSRLWYMGPEGLLQELHDSEQLVIPETTRPTIKTLKPEILQPSFNTPRPHGHNDVLIHCGDVGYLITGEQVLHIERPNDTTKPYSSRFPQGRRQHNTAPSIPCINLARFLFGRKNQMTHYRILVQIPEAAGIWLEVDNMQLCTSSIERGTELEPINLPYPANALFTDACHDENTGQWYLKIMPCIRFGTLPWPLKKSLIRAISGWWPPINPGEHISLDTTQHSSD